MRYDIVSKQEPDGAAHTCLNINLITNSTIQERGKFVTYHLNFTNIDDPHGTPLLNDMFQSKNGTLLLDMVHTAPPIMILGARDPFFFSAMADPSGKVTVKGFPFEKDTMYRVRVEVMTVDSFNFIISDDKRPIADFTFSGDVPSNTGEVRMIPEFPLAPAILSAALIISIMLGTRLVYRWNLTLGR